jgi:hypothetical protein
VNIGVEKVSNHPVLFLRKLLKGINGAVGAADMQENIHSTRNFTKPNLKLT